uniref:E2F-associated phosphoprotein n=1 Tax=Plectus sambesii TaxID=2011161 RepID=A0A914W5M7_9BILA
MDRLEPLERLEKDYYLGEKGGWFSDGENRDSDSSDDEVQKKYAAIAGVKLCSSSNKRASKRKDDFESDMDGELDAAFSKHTTDLVAASLSDDRPCSSDAAPTMNDKKESKKRVHFKEDEDGMKREDETVDPLYDPNEDEDNEAWVAEHRRSQRQTPQQPCEGEDGDALPNSDAVLSCPACMSLLTRDCQRHELYKTQYRAMFVQNCRVVEGETLYMPSTSEKRTQKRKRDSENPLKANARLVSSSVPNDCKPEDLFRPVVCAVCNTEIGVIDRDDVYHLFNVLSGYS